jgi:hypothetical protein
MPDDEYYLLYAVKNILQEQAAVKLTAGLSKITILLLLELKDFT